ncbi:hypothetical protein Trydic_g3113 [Trypoxylus dichotomus]
MCSSKRFGIYFTFAFFFIGVNGIKNLIGTETEDCIHCLCYIKTQCFDLSTCANYTINYEYWLDAGAPTINVDDDDVDEASYLKCMADNNCILNTIEKYLTRFTIEDCICDRNIDCRDKISRFVDGGRDCKQVKKSQSVRYNYCARTRDLPELDTTVECVNVNLK